MSIVAKVVQEVVLNDQMEAFDLLQKSHDNDFENISLVVNEQKRDSSNFVVKELSEMSEDGNVIQLYKSNEVDHRYILTKQRVANTGDLIVSDGVEYTIMWCGDVFSLYSIKSKKFHSEIVKIKSIEEIFNILDEKQIKFRIYRLI